MKKIVVISTIMAIFATALSAFSVFAAPSTADTSASAKIFGSQLDELNADRVFYTKFVSDRQNFVKPSDPLKLQKYLAHYAADLAQAESIVKARGTVMATSKSTSAQVNAINGMDSTARANLAVLLHDMRDLQMKILQAR